MAELGTVQVPADVLNALLTSVDDLRKNVGQLTARIEGRGTGHISEKHIEAATAFTCFPKLPREIREMIWDCILNVSQIVGVRECVVHHNPYDSTSWLIPTTPKRALLDVCRESRRRAEKILSLSSGCIYLHPKLDTIWFENMGVFEEFCLTRSGNRAVEKVAVSENLMRWKLFQDEFRWAQQWTGGVRNLPSIFPQLKQLILLVGPELRYGITEPELVNPRRLPYEEFPSRVGMARQNWALMENESLHYIQEALKWNEKTFEEMRQQDANEDDLITMNLSGWMGFEVKYMELVQRGT